MGILSTFAERLKELMTETGSTQMQIAKIIGCGHGSVSRWLNAQNLPNISSLIKLSNYFSCSLDFFLGRTDEPEIKDLTLYSDLPDRLKMLASQKEMSMYAMSLKLHIDETILYRWTRGKVSPNLYSLVLIADFFGCTTDYLIGRKD